VIVCKLILTIVRAVAGSVVVIRDSPEGVKMVFVVRMEDSSSVIDRRGIKLCVVLGEFLVRKVNVDLKMILRSCWIVVINLYKTIFKSFKLVKEPLKGNKYLLDCAVTTVLAASLKQLCRLSERRKELHILVNCCPVTSVKAFFAQEQSRRLY
jgi:hypothetical protein